MALVSKDALDRLFTELKSKYVLRQQTLDHKSACTNKPNRNDETRLRAAITLRQNLEAVHRGMLRWIMLSWITTEADSMTR